MGSKNRTFSVLQHMGSDTVDLKKENRRILSLVQKKGPITKNALAELCQYQMSSFNRYFEPLLQGGMVMPSGTDTSSGGRRPTLFEVNADSAYALGVNIATTYLEILVIDLKVRVLSKERFDLPRDILPEQALAQVRDSVFRQLESLRLDRRRIVGMGLSTIGPFDREKGAIMPQVVRHLDPQWVGYPIRSALESLCGFPVQADIGVNNAAIAEYFFGHGREAERILCVRCGMSIKTAYVVSGAVVRTSNNIEDAFGHMSVDFDGLPCVCGNYGCIECYSSIPAIVERFRGELKKGRISLVDKPLDEVSYFDVLAAAEQEDGVATEVVTHAATMLGGGLANYINLLNPDVITLDSLIIRNSTLYYETAADVAKRKSRLLNKDIDTTVIKNSYFEDPATVGAAIVAMECYLFHGDNLSG